MSESTEQRLRMRRYLLGQLSESECESVEEQYLTDSTYRQEVRILEDDLVDEYVAKRMPREDLSQFEAHYLATQQKQEKVLVARALNRYYVSRRRTYRWFGVMDRRTAYALAASILLVTLIAGVWLWMNRQPQKPFDRYEAQLKTLNDGSSRVSPDVRSIILPNATRQADPSVDIALRESAKVVELLLILPQVEYESFGAVIKSQGTNMQYTLNGIAAQMTQDGKVVGIRLPAELLKPDTYYIEINGVSKDGTVASVADYTFSASASLR